MVPSQRGSALGGWGFWFLAVLFYAYEFVHRVSLCVLTGPLKANFTLNEHQLGIIGAMYFYAYAAFQLPSGMLLDRFGTKRFLIAASALLTLGSFLFATTHSLKVIYFSRFLVGAGSAFAFIGCLKIATQWLPMRTFPLVVGLTNLFGTLGALLGGKPLALMIQATSAKEALLFLSNIGLVLTLLLAFGLREKTPPSDRSLIPPSFFSGLRRVTQTPQSWVLAFYATLLVLPIVTLPEMWGVEYLKTAYGLPAPTAAGITHTIFIGTALGGPFIGWLILRYPYERRCMQIATLLAGLCLSSFLYWHHSIVSLYPLLFCYGLFTANMLLCFSLIVQQHPPHAQGVAIGFMNMLMMAGGGLIQDRVGWLLYTLRERHEGPLLLQDFRWALSILPFCLLIALMISCLIHKKEP